MLGWLFDDDFMPHGHCYAWRPGLLWTHAVADGLIALAYLAIPMCLVYFLWRRPRVRFAPVLWLFAAFIFLCGITHVFDIVTIWEPVYRVEAWFKVICALVSAAAAVILIPLLPRALSMRTVEELEAVNAQLSAQVDARVEAERALTAKVGQLEVMAGRLRRLAGRLTRTEQRERKRVASLLHDELQQYLVAAQLQLTSARQQLGSDGAPALDRVSRLVEQAMVASRDLTRQLRPPVLYEDGLVPAVRWLADQMAERHGLDVAVSASESVPELSDDDRALLFDAVRELLFNVVKHAGTRSASVRIVEGDDEIRVAVVDEGRGFDASRPFVGSESDAGWGLFSVRERLAAIGGALEVESRPGTGTTTTIRFPAPP